MEDRYVLSGAESSLICALCVIRYARQRELLSIDELLIETCALGRRAVLMLTILVGPTSHLVGRDYNRKGWIDAWRKVISQILRTVSSQWTLICTSADRTPTSQLVESAEWHPYITYRRPPNCPSFPGFADGYHQDSVGSRAAITAG